MPGSVGALAFAGRVLECPGYARRDGLVSLTAVGGLLDIARSLLSFYFHRIVLVTDDTVYVYRDLPFHIPGRRPAAYRRRPGVVRLGSPNPESGISRFIRRGQLTFHDGMVAYHQFWWIRRVQYIEQEGNIPAGV